MNGEATQAFALRAALWVPGYLALFDIANFKRRNFHLGHRIGDQDIAEFEELAQTMLDGRGVWQRISGGR